MGSGNSKGSGGRSTSFRRDSGSGSSSRADRYPEARPYPAPSYSYPPQSYPSPSEYHGSAAPTPSYSYPSQSEYHGHAAPTPSYSYPSQSEYHGHAASRERYSYPSQSEYHGHATPTQHYSYPSQSEYHNHASSTESYSYAAPSESYAPKSRGSNNKLQRRYSMIADNYHSLDEVTADLAKAGLESSNLIVGIDFTKSNEWTGARSFNRRSLHHIGDSTNPYEQAISIIGRTLSAFDEDNLIPCFGFGDASTHDQDVFSFYPDERSCSGFEEALRRYREIVPHLRLAGPTSFAPIIEMAMTIVEQSGGQYHVLLIIADGQVTRSVDTEHGHLSPQEQNTVDAIVRASEYPLSIVLVGVGDGPWDMMKEFDDNIPARAFDNFQFVNFTEIMSKIMPLPRKEMEFALAALMEIPAQYKATIELRILGRRRGKAPDRVPLPPPIGSYGMPKLSAKLSQSSSFQHSPPHDYGDAKSAGTAPPASSSWDIQVCPICLNNPKDMAFGCGHQTCRDCGSSLTSCPICRSPIDTRIKLY